MFNSAAFKPRLRKPDGSVLVRRLLHSRLALPSSVCGHRNLVVAINHHPMCGHRNLLAPIHPICTAGVALQQTKPGGRFSFCLQLEGHADWMEVLALASKHGYEELFKKCTDFMRVGGLTICV